jgi:glycosyltransferase involved in cell wall biosynthesis
LVDRFTSDWLRGTLISLNALGFKPDVVHVLEFQNGGYSYLRAAQMSKAIRAAKLLLTPYGSDIYWFQKFPAHLKRISKLVARADAFSAECLRDELLATKYGFSGALGPRIPAFGAMELNSARSLNSARNRIAIKGYQNHWGQALNALSAIESISSELHDYEITLFSCNRVTIKAASLLSRKTGLNVTAYGKGALSNAEVQRIMSESIAMIALSTSDGISASMIEAMANGAVPIQSRTSCCDEWLDQGVGGFLVDFDNVKDVAEKLKFIVQNPGFRESAALHNFASLQAKLSPEKATQAAFETYEMLKLS